MRFKTFPFSLHVAYKLSRVPRGLVEVMTSKLFTTATMTWLTVTEYLCENLKQIYSVSDKLIRRVQPTELLIYREYMCSPLVFDGFIVVHVAQLHLFMFSAQCHDFRVKTIFGASLLFICSVGRFMFYSLFVFAYANRCTRRFPY